DQLRPGPCGSVCRRYGRACHPVQYRVGPRIDSLRGSALRHCWQPAVTCPRTMVHEQQKTKGSQMRTRISIAGCGLVLLLLTGCVSQRKTTEQMLTWSGFKKIPAATPAKQELLASLPRGQISKVTRNGKPYFVYPDQKQKLFYVGNQTEYE